MGLFGRNRRPSASRVAEGGPDLSSSSSANAAANTSSSTTAGTGAVKSQPQPHESKQKVKKSEDPLDLFGADSDDSDDDATINRYANGDDDGEPLDEQQALATESKKVSTLLSKVSSLSPRWTIWWSAGCHSVVCECVALPRRALQEVRYGWFGQHLGARVSRHGMYVVSGLP